MLSKYVLSALLIKEVHMRKVDSILTVNFLNLGIQCLLSKIHFLGKILHLVNFLFYICHTFAIFSFLLQHTLKVLFKYIHGICKKL